MALLLIGVHCCGSHSKGHFLIFEPFLRITPSTLMNEEDEEHSRLLQYLKNPLQWNGSDWGGNAGEKWKPRSPASTDYR